MTASFVFAAVAALAGDALAILLVWSSGYCVAKRQFNERQRVSFAAINQALTELKLVQSTPGDKVIALLRRATSKRSKLAGDVAARDAEFQTL